MSLEFKYYKIDDIGKVVSGGTPSTSKNEYWYGDIGWITPKDLSSYEDIYISQGERNITEEGLNNSSAKLVPKNTVLMTSRAPIGYIAIADNELSTNQGFKSLICDENICHYKYFYYWLKLNIKYIINNSSGSTFNEISGGTFKNLEISLPSINEQKAISSVLWTIDEKISVLKKININLFTIVSSLQTEWMVNFTPFKSEQFKSSAFGLIPENWNVGKLSDIIELLDSKRIPLSGQERENMEKIYPYYGAASLMDYVDDYIFDGIYLLIGEDGTVVDDKGFPILQYVWGKFWVNNHAHIVKGKNGFNVDSLYLLLSKTNIQSIVTGAVQAKVNQSNLKSIEIIIPPVEVMEKFNELIKPFFDSIRSNNDEIKKLQKLRDTLLPKLMSGEIDVSKINCDLE